MELTDLAFYTISAILVFIATMQRSKNEETMKEYNILFLPVFTILGFILIILLIILIPSEILNAIFLVCFMITGYWTLVSNSFFFIEFTEYEVEENLYNIEMSDSEFSEIMIESKNPQKVKKKKTGPIRFLKSIYHATKYAILNMKIIDFFVYLFSALTVFSYAYTKNELIAEIISMSICFQTIREVKLFSVVNGYTILVLYFMYDIIWVSYGMNLETYTSDIDVPIKLVLPISLHGYEMTGFGDLLIPAFFIAICKKYGEVKNCLSMWYVTYISFCIGIIVGVNADIFQAEDKPMLIYISPIVGLTAFLYAAILGRAKDFLTYKRK